MSPRISWAEKLKRWRQMHEEEYARVLMSPPEETTLLRAVPFPGVILVMGAKGSGKSAMAHASAEKLHTGRALSAVLHLPMVPPDLQKHIQKLLPDWLRVVTTTASWPKRSVVIYDEAAQSAHARRTQSGDAVELDNLMSISRQRQQLIIFISHHSRKLDPSVIRDVGMIGWKQPTYAHWLFERNELTDFTLKAVDFYRDMKTESQRLKTTMIVDLHHLVIKSFKNNVPTYWSESLSHLFEDIKSIRKAPYLG